MMVNPDVAKALFDPKLEAIIDTVKHKSKTVKEIAKELNEKQSRLYYHIQKLVNLGLMTIEKEKLVGNIIEKYYTSSHLRDASMTFEGEVAMEYHEKLLTKALFNMNQGINLLKEDLSSDPPPIHSNAKYSEQIVNLTLEEWEHINEEILKTINLRSSQEVPNSNSSDYKFIVLTYKDDARSE